MSLSKNPIEQKVIPFNGQVVCPVCGGNFQGTTRMVAELIERMVKRVG